MAYSNQPIENYVDPVVAVPKVEYHDRVRWGPILSGLFTAIASQLVLKALGEAIGLTSVANSGSPRSDIGDVESAIDTWSIISLLISLFIGGWVTTRAAGPMNKNSALLNGVILWATTLAISSWLLSNGVPGAFGIVGSNAAQTINQVQQNGVPLPDNLPNVTPQETRDIASDAAKTSWAFAIGSLLALVSSLFGASLGVHHPRKTITTTFVRPEVSQK